MSLHLVEPHCPGCEELVITPRHHHLKLMNYKQKIKNYTAHIIAMPTLNHLGLQNTSKLISCTLDELLNDIVTVHAHLFKISVSVSTTAYIVRLRWMQMLIVPSPHRRKVPHQQQLHTFLPFVNLNGILQCTCNPPPPQPPSKHTVPRHPLTPIHSKLRSITPLATKEHVILRSFVVLT